jgi:predicted dehydrogenase
MEFEKGIYINYFGSWVGQGRQTDGNGNFRIAGSKGAIHLDYAGISLVSKGRIHVLAEADKVQLKCEGIEYALREFRQAILTNRTPETNVEDNFQSFAIACAAKQSCRTGQPIIMAEFLLK